MTKIHNKILLSLYSVNNILVILIIIKSSYFDEHFITKDIYKLERCFYCDIGSVDFYCKIVLLLKKLGRTFPGDRRSTAIVGKMLAVGFQCHCHVLPSQHGECKSFSKQQKIKINCEGGQGRTGNGILRRMCLVSEKKLCITFIL